MSYCTQQDLIDRFGEVELIELTDEHNVGEIEATKVNRSITDIDGTIDGYLTSRFQLPLSEIPPVLVKIACHLVRYDLYDSPTADVEKRHDDSLQSLREIRDGKLSLGINPSGSEPETNNSASMTTGGSVFNRKDNGFI